MGYDGHTFTYDGQGRRLTKDGISFTYDSNGRVIKQSNGLEFFYDHTGVAGIKYNTQTYFYRKDVQGNVIGLIDSDGVVIARYFYDAWGAVHAVTDNNGVELTNASHIANLNPFRYRSYYYDSDIKLYFLKTRYYDLETGRFITIDDISYLDSGTINGLNLYAYRGDNPVMGVDPDGTAWWNWLISGLQVALGIALCFVPGTQGIGLGLIVGGSLGLISNAVSPMVAQLIGGVSSISNGWGAFSTGMSILGLGVPGLIGGIGLMLIGSATMLFGANEIVTATTGTNYIQKWTGVDDATYAWSYFGLNLASSIGQIAGNVYYLESVKLPRVGYDGKVNGFRYKTKNGKMFDFDYPHGNIRKNHFHGWNGPGLTGRTRGQHWNYLRLIWWLISGR